jgi:hypothetical protein
VGETCRLGNQGSSRPHDSSSSARGGSGKRRRVSTHSGSASLGLLTQQQRPPHLIHTFKAVSQPPGEFTRGYKEDVPQPTDTRFGGQSYCPICRAVDTTNQYSCPGARNPCQSKNNYGSCKHHPRKRDPNPKSKSRRNARSCPTCYPRWLTTTPGVCKRWGCGATDCPGRKNHKLCRLGACDSVNCFTCRNAQGRLNNDSRKNLKRKREEEEATARGSSTASTDDSDSPSPSSSSSVRIVLFD